MKELIRLNKTNQSSCLRQWADRLFSKEELVVPYECYELHAVRAMQIPSPKVFGTGFGEEVFSLLDEALAQFGEIEACSYWFQPLKGLML